MARLFLLIGALLGGILLGVAIWLALVPGRASLLVLNGYVYPIEKGRESFEIRAAVALRAQQLEGELIDLRTDEHLIELPSAKLGLLADQDIAVALAEEGLSQLKTSLSKQPGLWLWRRFSNRPQAFTMDLTTRFDQARAAALLQSLAVLVDREPIDAKLLISEHKIVESRPGRRLSVPATLVRLQNVAFGGSVVVDAVVDQLTPRITEEALAPVDVTRVLSSYETSFRGKAGPRAVNIRTAGGLLNGAIVLPGEVLSFNEEVGRRVHGRGFVDAPVIINDELETDVGGGVCQVATTLHAAAVFGNLEIVTRRSHSRPSGYAPLGLDATVIDGKVDLQIRNPFDEPVLVHVSFPDVYRIRVEILGRNPEVKVDHAFTVTHREPFARRVWHREEIPLGGFEMKQKGSEGMDVVSVLRIQHKDGKQDRRSYHSKYYPVPEVFWLGEGATPAALPKMPEGATALVIDGGEPEGSSERSEEEVPSFREADGSFINARP